MTFFFFSKWNDSQRKPLRDTWCRQSGLLSCPDECFGTWFQGSVRIVENLPAKMYIKGVYFEDYLSIYIYIMRVLFNSVIHLSVSLLPSSLYSRLMTPFGLLGLDLWRKIESSKDKLIRTSYMNIKFTTYI